MKRYKIIILILAVALTLESIFLICLWLRRPKKVTPPPLAVVAPAVKARIAIVIDDWGYNMRNFAVMDKIKYPLTVSILPNLHYSTLAARELSRRGFEVILHLPMEPREEYRLERNTVLTSLDEQEVFRIIDADLKSIPAAKGVSNHMGSRATEDARTMRIIFRELKKRHLYFLDSLVSGSSVCRELAGQMRIDFAARDVFLDNEDEPGYIRAQINQLKNQARSRGYAVGIGHDRKNTLEVLQEEMPRLAREGYRFVFVSEVVR